jgi:hypothetical protein
MTPPNSSFLSPLPNGSSMSILGPDLKPNGAHRRPLSGETIFRTAFEPSTFNLEL